jgi:phenylalanyl-tRNA synthetase beta chain
VIAESVAAADVAASIRAHAGDLLTSLDLFDIYRGRPLADADKSLAWRLRFQALDRTLTEAEVDGAIAAVTAGLASDVGGRIRT